jgi:hypothetical protein
MWDVAVADFLAGGQGIPATLEHWATSYQGRGRGAVEWDAIPEPFLGPLTRRPAGVFLALNPGRADLRFQGRDGIFAEEIRAHGSYSAWAASWPYLRKPWIEIKGKNRHHASRLQFLHTWTGDSALQDSAMVCFELYPWHSTAVTSRMRPDPALIKEFVWDPVAELAAPVFAFGAPWFPILEKELGLRIADRLGAGGRKYASAVASRSVAVMKNEHGVTVIAERHIGSAHPPSREETLLLREALERWL